jgi:ABC-type sugar transport system ATPase subunit
MRLLETRGISKYYPETATLANDDISLSLAAGELRAVVGENGAGKSTLAKIIAGLTAPDRGEILVRGKKIRLGSVRAAEAAGIGYVPQISLLAENLSVAENLVLGSEPRFLGLFLDKRKTYVEAALLVERYGFRIDPEARVSELSPAERRQAEIARALARGGELLVLDEPTSLLSELEAASLFELLGRLAAAGKGILFITHRLAELGGKVSAMSVLREGRLVAELAAKPGEGGFGLDEAALSKLMSRESGPRARATAARRGAAPDGAGAAAAGVSASIEVLDLVLYPGAKPFSFRVRGGEALGVAALAGNGLDRLEDCLSGMGKPVEGRILLGGEDLGASDRGRLRAASFGYVPARREARGLCLEASIRDNLLVLERDSFGPGKWLGLRSRDDAARALADSQGLAAETKAATGSLSGGNRQRLVLARELGRGRNVFLLAEPFQGLDTAAQGESSELIRGIVGAGGAVILLSSSVDELLFVANRIAVLYRGSLVRIVEVGPGINAQALFPFMTGFGTEEGGT